MTRKEKDERAAVDLDAAFSDGRLQLDRCYAIVTVSPIYHGRLTAVTVEHYVLADAAWVVETGRLSEFVKDPASIAAEAEHVGQVVIERGSVMAIYPTADGKVTTR